MLEKPPLSEMESAEVGESVRLSLKVKFVVGKTVEDVCHTDNDDEEDDIDDNDDDDDTLQMAQDWLNSFTSSTTHF